MNQNLSFDIRLTFFVILENFFYTKQTKVNLKMGVCQSGDAEAGASGAWAEDADMQNDVNNGGMRTNKATGEAAEFNDDNRPEDDFFEF